MIFGYNETEIWGHCSSLVMQWLGCTSLTHIDVGEFKAACLVGLDLSWYTLEPLCCNPACTYTHLHMWHSKASQVLTLILKIGPSYHPGPQVQ